MAFEQPHARSVPQGSPVICGPPRPLFTGKRWGANCHIAQDELRLQRQRAGDADALALAAGKFVGVTAGGVARQSDEVERHPPHPFGAGAIAQAVDGVGLSDDRQDLAEILELRIGRMAKLPTAAATM